MRKLLSLLLLLPLASCDSSPTISPGGPQLSFRVEQLSEQWHNVTPQHESAKGRLTVTGGVSGGCNLGGTVEGDSARIVLRITSVQSDVCPAPRFYKYTARISNLHPGWYDLAVMRGTAVLGGGRVRVR